MAFLNPTVTLISATAATREAFFTALYNYFVGGTSTKWSLKSNGHNSNAFTIKPADSTQGTFEINFRYRTAEADIEVIIDYLGNTTNPGDGTTAPTLTDDSARLLGNGTVRGAWSPLNLHNLGSDSYDTKFYLIELDDSVIFLFHDETRKFNTFVSLVGKIYQSFYDDPDFTGLGWGAGLADMWISSTSSSYTANAIFTGGGSNNRGLFKSGPNIYVNSNINPGGGTTASGTSDFNNINGQSYQKFSCPVWLKAGSLGGYAFGYCKYLFVCNQTQHSRTVLTSGQDTYIHFYKNSSSLLRYLLPWNKDIIPIL